MRQSDKQAILMAVNILSDYCGKRSWCWSRSSKKQSCPFNDTEDGNRCMLSAFPGRYNLEKIEKAVEKL